MGDGRFPNPYELEDPPGAEGWQELYPYSTLFSEGRRDRDENQFWFWDSMHWGWAMTPWDADHLIWAIAALSQYNSRHYLVPPANGIDFRIHLGYPYFSPVTVDDPEQIGARAEQFMQRAGHYFANWDDLYDNWLTKVKENIAAIEQIDFSPLPEVESFEEIVATGRGVGSGWDIQEQYHRFVDLAQRIWNYHFEFLNLGYAAYLDFFGFCKEAFPSIPDLAIAKMVAGIEVDLFRPNEELKVLAAKAREMGIGGAFSKHDDPDSVHAAMGDQRDAWEALWKEREDPWFNFSSGTGFYYTDKTWIQDRSVPYGFINDYVTKLERDESIDRPMDEVRAERDRIVAEYRELLQTDEDREAFDGKLGLARTVFPYVENHNFYIEHWSMSVFWRKSRELGAMLAKEGFFSDETDIFYVRREEVDVLLQDLWSAWAVGVEPEGPHHWPPIIERRRGILQALKDAKPDMPKALGPPPDVVTEPFTIMLWGINTESINQWLGAEEGGDVTGMAASPGVVEGPVRVVFDAADVGDVQDGEILVAPITAPSWAPAFAKAVGVVTDIGGLMSHAAIVCREYGVPAVTGTGNGTAELQTGDRIRVDGNTGTITRL